MPDIVASVAGSRNMRYTEAIVTTGTNLQHRLRETVGTSVPGIVVAVVDPDGVREAVAVGMADLRAAGPPLRTWCARGSR